MEPTTKIDERPAAPGTPTQVANPRRTTLRTIVQAAIGLLLVLVPLLNLCLVALNDYLRTQDALPVPPWAFLVVNGGIAVTTFIIGLVTRLLAVPGVNAFIEQHLPWLAPIHPAR